MRIVLALFLLGAVSLAAPTPNAGPDQTNAFYVPIVLDGRASTGTTNFFWQQISGSPTLDLIGQDRVMPVVLSAHNAGDFVFRLYGWDGSTTNSDDMTLHIIASAEHLIYVDNTLSTNITDGKYSTANRDSSGSAGNCYTNLQTAHDVTVPGDTVYIRGSTYVNTVISGVNQHILWVTRHGTAIAPIRYKAYPGEMPIIQGLGYSDADANADGLADGPTLPGKREQLVLAEADYTQFFGLDISLSENQGLLIRSNFIYAAECSSHDNWNANFEIASNATNQVHGSFMRWCEAKNSRHGDGFFFDNMQSAFPGLVTECGFIDCISYYNGYTDAGITKVLPIGGDPAGGGNSDGDGTSKIFQQFTGPGLYPNYSTNNYVVRIFAYHNADDGFDNSGAEMLLEDNRALDNGPEGMRGYKTFLSSEHNIYRGNLAYHNQDSGFENRVKTNSTFLISGNTSVSNVAKGYFVITTDPGSSADVRNNLAVSNLSSSIVGGTIVTNNWTTDGVGSTVGQTGDAKLLSLTFTPSFSFPAGSTIQAKRALLEAQLLTAFMPATNSPLKDAALFVVGYHCPTADDDPINPMPPTAPGRHWLGAAPDIGAFEIGVSTGGNPPLIPSGVTVSILGRTSIKGRTLTY